MLSTEDTPGAGKRSGDTGLRAVAKLSVAAIASGKLPNVRWHRGRGGLGQPTKPNAWRLRERKVMFLFGNIAAFGRCFLASLDRPQVLGALQGFREEVRNVGIVRPNSVAFCRLSGHWPLLTCRSPWRGGRCDRPRLPDSDSAPCRDTKTYNLEDCRTLGL